MRNRKGVISTVLILLAFFGTQAVFAGARFASIRGTVQIHENGKWVNATIAKKLETGMAIQTAYKSAAVIQFAAGGQMALAQNTKIILKESPVAAGTDRDIYLEHGQLSAFVRKGDVNAPNRFRVRTPTVVAGVRGSLLVTNQSGDDASATAAESDAYFEKNPPIDSIEALKLEMLARQAKMAANMLKLAEFAVIAADPARYNMTAEQVAQEIKDAKDANQKLQIELAVAQKELLSLEFKAKQVAEVASTPDEPAENEQKPLKQGDTAKKVAGVVKSTAVVKKESTKPAQFITSGTTSSEQQFTSQNTDSNVGVGNDFQQIYTSTTTVTQPTTSGLPTLKKF